MAIENQYQRTMAGTSMASAGVAGAAVHTAMVAAGAATTKVDWL